MKISSSKRMMKRIVSVASIFALLLTTIVTTASFAEADQGWSVKTLDDDGMIMEITYTETDEERAAEYMSKYDIWEFGGCSAVRTSINGDVYVGRNYDFYCSDAPAIIVRNNAGPVRTIGIANTSEAYNNWVNGSDEVVYVWPYLCSDIMSEAGIYAETNIRPTEDGFACSHTNPGMPRRCTEFFMQIMLSQYETIDEILSHINDYDWYDVTVMGFQQSFFLCDKTGRSVVVEFAADEVRWEETYYNANFYINDDWYAAETQGCGELRVSAELALEPFVRSEDDIFTMMNAASYDQFYSNRASVEYAEPEFWTVTGYDKYTAAEDPEGCYNATKALMDQYAAMTWEERVKEHTWETVFMVAANVTEGYMHVHFSEHYGIDFTVAFD